jgi:Mg-chelatase subunit ChlD
LQRKVRVKKSANLILFVVDASWSMAVAERMSATKGAIMSLLTDAYQRRDRVGLIVFQKDRATEVLTPTNSVTLAKAALADIPRPTSPPTPRSRPGRCSPEEAGTSWSTSPVARPGPRRCAW